MRPPRVWPPRMLVAVPVRAERQTERRTKRRTELAAVFEGAAGDEEGFGHEAGVAACVSKDCQVGSGR